MKIRASVASRSLLSAAFVAGIPVMLGYTSIGLAFGLVLVGSGLPWWLSPLMAVVVYAGAAQFMGAGLLASGAGVIEIGLLTLLMNARHAVYGLSVLERYAPARRAKPYLIFSLTDETYGLVTTVRPPEGLDPTRFYLALSALNQAWWVLGCTLGAALGKALPFDTTGLDFAMTALFTVLLVEQLRTTRRAEPYLAAIAASAVAYAFFGPANFILAATVGSCALLLALRRRLEPGARR